LTDDVYARLASRNRLQRHYAEQLEVIIKSTSAHDNGGVIPEKNAIRLEPNK
jgi:hypothetical protein